MAQIDVAKLWGVLNQVKEGWESYTDDLAINCVALLKSIGQEFEECVKVDYTSKHVEELHKKYQTIVAEASSFMVEQARWGIYIQGLPRSACPSTS